jgi:hypothetical protein
MAGVDQSRECPVPKLELVQGGAPSALGAPFEVGFTDDDNGQQRLPLTAVLSVPFEACLPVRGFPSYKGQRHLNGRWLTATTQTLVGHESWLERDRLLLLDFGTDVVGIASQPFWLFWTTSEGKIRSHAPDYFARLADGSALVLDVRAADRIKPRDRAAFDRLLATDLVNNGLPIHIGAALLGHLNLHTTRGYVAVFNEDVVRHYREFLHRRRQVRSEDEYKPVTGSEWSEFGEHFDRRKVELGGCTRPYGSACQHEHSCLRAPCSP